jgi:hypothetical protein
MKILTYLALACPLVLLAFTFSVKAEEPPERGSRTVASFTGDLDRDGAAENVTIREHAADDGNLALLLADGKGRELANDHLVGALDRDESDVSTYGVSLKTNAAGSLVVTSAKDWGTSLWANTYTIAYRAGAFVLAGYDYEFQYRERSGRCSLDLLTGKARVNGKSKRFPVPKNSLAEADGLELLKLCQDLGTN